ncbi:hypothetical protein [Methylobacterium sp. WL6]|uniref:hypothetical protein n=1 Tax=Methylobacterium sp. WL6 TaxID=2603901 RepID=UPI0011CB299B|nr:hypothetical protein [Methylobacterium sp. WL6]TXN72569.1 hypothetical protein FV230_04405 [Methylobacterium sp. WL6]
MRNWLKTALFVSALSPSLISVALARVWDKGGLTWDALWYAVPGFAGILVVRYIVDALRWNGETFPITLKKVEANDTLMLGIVATYFVPFIGKAIDITVGAVLAMLALGAVVLWMMSAIPANPVMRVLGYRFYKAEAANGVVYTLITQRDLLDPKQVRTVKRISGSMLLEVV